jgi:hypothetical protein
MSDDVRNFAALAIAVWIVFGIWRNTRGAS